MMSTHRVFVVAIAALALAAAAPSWAQPGGGRGGFGGGRGGGGFGMTGLLMNEDVQKEIELVDDQVDELQQLGEELRDEMRSEMGSMFQEMRDATDEEREAMREEIGEKMAEFQKKAEGRVKDVLLPHQFDRLKQINTQQQLNAGGGQGLMRGPLAEELGITDAQREELAEKAREVQEEMQKKIAELRAEAQDDLLSVLKPEQRKKLESMMGEKFEMEQPDFGRGQGGQRGQRGQGGRGGRGDRGGNQPDA
jgi:Spy/CpxP family protein refolding chaperone